MTNSEQLKTYISSLDEGRYLASHIPRMIKSFEFLEKNLDLSSYKKGLDLGSYGHFSQTVTHFHKDFIFDISNYELREPFPVAAEQYEMIMCMEVIEHLKDRDSNKLEDIDSFKGTGILNLLCESNRLLKQDGILFLTTPNVNCYLGVLRLLLHQNPYFYTPHSRELSLKELERYISICGFDIEILTTENVWEEVSNENPKFSTSIKKLEEFMDHNGFSKQHRKDDFFILARKKRAPATLLTKEQYFQINFEDLFPKK